MESNKKTRKGKSIPAQFEKGDAKKNRKLEDVPGFLPGFAPKRDVEVHSQAVRLQEGIETARLATKERNSREERLIEIMEKKGIEFYAFQDVRVRVKIKKHVNVREVSEKPEKNKLAKAAGKAKAFKKTKRERVELEPVNLDDNLELKPGVRVDPE